MIKYTTQFLAKLEDLIAESDYILRYEKGNFKAGYCLLREQKIMIVNKFFTMEGKINALLEIIRIVPLETSKFSDKNIKLYEELTKAEVSIWRHRLTYEILNFENHIPRHRHLAGRARDRVRVWSVPLTGLPRQKITRICTLRN